MILALLLLVVGGSMVHGETHAFLVFGDPQYLAEKSPQPQQLDPYSEQANQASIAVLKQIAGMPLPENMGGGHVSDNLLGVIVTGDLIDSADKHGGAYPAMQRFEWDRYKQDYGLTGDDGNLPYPVYELHGNHDGPQGDTFVVEEIAARNKQRPGVVNISANGLHYSWRFGPLHCVALGMYVGEGDERRPEHHYAPRRSLEFLQKDLAEHVGDSGRPVILSFHLHPHGPAFDWPPEDLQAFWKAIEPYNVVGLFHGHTHGSPPSRLRWDGERFAADLADGVDVFNPDDIAAAKTDPRDPGQGVGLLHGLLYVELIDQPGVDDDRLVVRSYTTRDNWATHGWHTRWTRAVSVPESCSAAP